MIWLTMLVMGLTIGFMVGFIVGATMTKKEHRAFRRMNKAMDAQIRAWGGDPESAD